MDFNDCNRSDCPFRNVPLDEYNGRCFKCGRNDRFRGNNYWLFMILWIILGLILLANEPESEPEFEPETEVAPISVTSYQLPVTGKSETRRRGDKGKNNNSKLITPNYQPLTPIL